MIISFFGDRLSGVCLFCVPNLKSFKYALSISKIREGEILFEELCRYAGRLRFRLLRD